MSFWPDRCVYNNGVKTLPVLTNKLRFYTTLTTNRYINFEAYICEVYYSFGQVGPWFFSIAGMASLVKGFHRKAAGEHPSDFKPPTASTPSLAPENTLEDYYCLAEERNSQPGCNTWPETMSKNYSLMFTFVLLSLPYRHHETATCLLAAGSS